MSQSTISHSTSSLSSSSSFTTTTSTTTSSNNNNNNNNTTPSPIIISQFIETEKSLHSHIIPLLQNENSPTYQSYQKILKRARLSSKKHLPLLQKFGTSETLPTGRASVNVFGDLTDDRPYDGYGRLIPRDEFKEETADVLVNEDEMREDLGGVRERVLNERVVTTDATTTMAVDDGEGGGDESSSLATKLTTPLWKIGEKPTVYGPPGLAPPVRGILHSEGNENFFSYDGSWKNGSMDGFGTYQFSDGTLYRGLFRRNVPDGPSGTATYDGGTVYIGPWVNGYPHGDDGRCTYRGGIIYEGPWKEGRRHGRKGRMEYPNGSYYEGGFRRGFFDGVGRYVSTASGVTFEGRFERGFVVGRGRVVFPDGRKGVKVWPTTWGEQGERGVTIHEAIGAIRDEWEDEIRAKYALDRHLYGAVNDETLEKHVRKVKDDIKEGRRLEKERKRRERDLMIQRRRTEVLERRKQMADDDDTAD